MASPTPSFKTILDDLIERNNGQNGKFSKGGGRAGTPADQGDSPRDTSVLPVKPKFEPPFSKIFLDFFWVEFLHVHFFGCV